MLISCHNLQYNTSFLPRCLLHLQWPWKLCIFVHFDQNLSSWSPIPWPHLEKHRSIGNALYNLNQWRFWLNKCGGEGMKSNMCWAIYMHLLSACVLCVCVCFQSCPIMSSQPSTLHSQGHNVWSLLIVYLWIQYMINFYRFAMLMNCDKWDISVSDWKNESFLPRHQTPRIVSTKLSSKVPHQFMSKRSADGASWCLLQAGWCHVRTGI